MNSLEIAIKSQEALVVLRSMEITQALNEKRYANKQNSKLIAELKRNIENAQVRHSLACEELYSLYNYRNTLATEESN